MSAVRNRPSCATAAALLAVALTMLAVPGWSRTRADRPTSALVTRTAAADAVAAPAQALEPARRLYTQTLAAFILDRDRAKAGRGFLQVTRLDPQFAPAWFNLGVLAEADRNWSQARTGFTVYLRLAPAGPDAARAEEQLHIVAAHEHAVADDAATRAAEYDGMIQRARALLAAKLFRSAIAEAARAQRTDPARWEAYAVVALCMGRQHKEAEAAKFETLAVSHASTDKREAVRTALDRQIAIWSR